MLCNVPTDFVHTPGQGNNAPTAPQVAVVPFEAGPEPKVTRGYSTARPSGDLAQASAALGQCTGARSPGPIKLKPSAKMMRERQGVTKMRSTAVMRRLISESQKKVKAEEDFAHELGSAEGHPLKRMRALLADLLICN